MRMNRLGRGTALGLGIALIAVFALGGGRWAQAQERGVPSEAASFLAPSIPPVVYVPLPKRAVVDPIIDCTALAGSSFAQVKDAPARILTAKVEAATPVRAEFCLVTGYVAPTIMFELRMPTKTYTGRYLQTGCGGNCGMIAGFVSPACDNKVAYSGAFAVGAENAGHQGSPMDGVWALGGEQVRIDFAYRASHAFSLAAKAILQAYYGQSPAYSYFQGCSDGGREALTEVQRYPNDFNGVLGGAAALMITEAMERFIWEARWGRDAQGKPVFDMAALETLHAAVIASCDAADGLKDGQIDDPRTCRFDPQQIACAPNAKAGTCLTQEQIDVAKRFYQGPVDEAGRHLYPGGEAYGAELNWAGGRGGLTDAGTGMLAENVRNMIFLGELPADVTVQTWKFDEATFRELTRRGAIYDANNPDLRPFHSAGGKLILWSGAADPAAGANALPDYYQRVENMVGGLRAARSFARLFVIPGVYHCGRGYIPYDQDFLGAMVGWVEKGAAPDKVIATANLADGHIRRRPVFA